MTLNKGDKVMVLDDALEGLVVAVNGDNITIETTEGFELTYTAKELIKSAAVEINYNAGQNIKQVLKEKEIPKPRSFVKEKKAKEMPVPEFDLHIEKLVKNFRGMNNFDILNLQVETARRHVEFAIQNRIPKIVFIHGVGEGVLKAELDFLLGRYDNIDFQDANYQKYGLGATEIYIRQKKP
ncbi:MAG: DNA mismatch repair protein MutS [Flavobacterium sp. BFFFF1]|uniref:Smr/MutS family protein n=1 Tax=Flavobacterium sp. BFFFF1 TaxID=2015557 RepID=UPI000BC6D04F|nr:Smr/MutS family protein [Flavobacterium sp. BFFFF1]OYU79994.1 MAG: DNA mismatch repair protein MutS [Flavobacterium sp. BFFFF1]